MSRAFVFCIGNISPREILHKKICSPLICIIDRPILIHILEYLCSIGIDSITILMHNMAEKIEETIGEGKRWGIDIDYVLINNPDNVCKELKVLAQSWDAQENILLVPGDVLPDFDSMKNTFEIQELLNSNDSCQWVYPNNELTGWAYVPANIIKKIPLPLDETGLFELLSTKVTHVYAKPYFSTRTNKEILNSNVLALKAICQSSQKVLLPKNAELKEPGVWVCPGAFIHPSTKLFPPVYIGEKSQIHKGAELGPYAIIENHSLIDSHTIVAHSLIMQGTYIGESLELGNSIARHNMLINCLLDTQIQIKDAFILSKLPHVSFISKWSNIVERILVSAACIVLSPVIFLLRKVYKNNVCMCTSTKVTRGSKDESSCFCWYRLSKNSKGMPTLRELILNLPSVALGKVHCIGLSPKTRAELNSLPDDWQDLYYSGRLGMISLADIEGQNSLTPEAAYAADALYEGKSSLLYDLWLLIRACARYVLPKNNKDKKLT